MKRTNYSASCAILEELAGRSSSSGGGRGSGGGAAAGLQLYLAPSQLENSLNRLFEGELLCCCSEG
jgi:alkylation response protein AidB-like acyl-CoA dehydrogenase